MTNTNYAAGVKFWARLLKSEKTQLARLELLQKAGLKIEGFKSSGSYEMSVPDDYLSPRIGELRRGIKNITKALSVAKKIQRTD